MEFAGRARARFHRVALGRDLLRALFGGEEMKSAVHVPYTEYDDLTHSYYVDGALVPSITQTLTEIGAIDKDYFTEEHARRGTLVHAYTEWWDKGASSYGKPLRLERASGETEHEHDVAAQYAAQWIKLREEIPFEIEDGGIEEKVFDPIHRYAGRLDRRVTMNAPCVSRALIEIKTNKSGYVPKWTGLQLAAQGHAKEPGELFRRFAFVLTLERYVIHEFKIEDYIQDRDTFLSMVNSVIWLRENL